MMKIYKYILLLIVCTIVLILINGCNDNMEPESPYYGNSGESEFASIRAIYCLRDMLIGEDAGGHWEVISQPEDAEIDTLLTSDNPCIEWSSQPCGQYELMYIVGDTCCRDTAIVRPLKCCIDLEINGDSLICHGATEILTAAPSNGTAPYTYSWSGGGTSSTKVVSSGGTYTVTVTDVNGCSKTASHTIVQNPLIILSLSPTDGGCGILGSIAGTASGGTGDLEYLWSTGDTSLNISGLANGTYTITVTDENGCTRSSSAVISSANNPTVSISCGDD